MMMQRRAVLAFVFGLAALAPVTAQEARPFPFDRTWIAESLAGERFQRVSRPTFRMAADGAITGHSGCNRYMGRGTLAGDKITLGPLAMTRMACFGAGGDNERMFAPAIGTATAWRMERRTLVLDTAKGPLRLRQR